MAAKKNSFYFPHDCNARSDEKLLAVRIRRGAEGYAVYFMLIEMLAAEADHTLNRDYYSIAFELHVEPETVRSVVEDFSLFSIDNDRFFSVSLNERMIPIDNLRQQRSNAGQMSALRRQIMKQTSVSTTVETTPQQNDLFVENNPQQNDLFVDYAEEEEEKKKKNQKENKEEEDKGEERRGEKGEKGEEGDGGLTHACACEAPLEKNELQEKKIYEIVMRKWMSHYKRHYATEYIPDYRSLTNDTNVIAEAVAKKMVEHGRDPDNPEEVKLFVDQLFESMRTVADQWQRQRWSLHTVATQFNELYNRIINGTSTDNNPNNRPGKGQRGISDERIREAMLKAAGVI